MVWVRPSVDWEIPDYIHYGALAELEVGKPLSQPERNRNDKIVTWLIPAPTRFDGESEDVWIMSISEPVDGADNDIKIRWTRDGRNFEPIQSDNVYFAKVTEGPYHRAQGAVGGDQADWVVGDIPLSEDQAIEWLSELLNPLRSADGYVEAEKFRMV